MYINQNLRINIAENYWECTMTIVNPNNMQVSTKLLNAQCLFIFQCYSIIYPW